MGVEPLGRLTSPVKSVLTALIHDPGQEWYSLDLGEKADLHRGTVHAILARLETLGWLTSRLEDEDPHKVGRPRRRYYRLTGEGEFAAIQALSRGGKRASVIERLTQQPASQSNPGRI